MTEAQPRPLDPSRWSPLELTAIAVLLAFLVVLMVVRLNTRRPDTARIPAMVDIVLLHAAGLRSDSVSVSDLAADLGFSEEKLLYWPNAFAQSSDPVRSSLSLLRGDLALNLDHVPGSSTLIPRLRDSGYSTALVTDNPSLSERIDALFDQSSLVDGPQRLADESARVWTETTGKGPSLLFVDLLFAGTPLHGKTTAASELKAAHSERITLLRGVLARIAQATSRSARPQLVVLMGASGLELGEHPDDTESPFDSHLRVPFLMGLRSSEGLPSGAQSAMVQSADLAPTLLDFLDLRHRKEVLEARLSLRGRSLEATAHGWSEEPVHEVLYLVGPRHVAARNDEWKLISEVETPWAISRERSRLFALAEDPGEQFDLSDASSMGPVGAELFDGLQSWLSRPVVLAGTSKEQEP